MAGGTTTIFDASSHAFSLPSPDLTADELEQHRIGDVGFGAKFVVGPNDVNPGLGPIFNNISCVSCHQGDGRGKPLPAGETYGSILFRCSMPGMDEHGGPNPVPGFGGQIQDHAVYGIQPEASISTSYEQVSGTYTDGTPYTLQKPIYTVTNAYIPFPANAMISPRVAPPVFGLGLLEAVDDQTILSHVDEGDVDGNGIKGKANMVWDEAAKKSAVGRFGLKANQPNLYQQTAAAFNGDMGITSPLFSTESCHGQAQDTKQYQMDLTEKTVRAVTYYTQTLAVPARRNVNDPIVQRGEKIFVQANCSGCHLPEMKTGRNTPVASLANQTIHPYTDLLVHDMGNGLADNRPDYLATGTEWRTSPLWGIGLTATVNGHTNFLHDGRARNLEEAILWHGGEAENAQKYFKKLSKSDREALLRFLGSL